jgi:putative serine protease PepD
VTSIRVSTQGRSYVFPAGAIVHIGSAPDCDVVLSAPTVGSHHAQLIPDGEAWRLVDDEVTGGIWAGGWVSSLRVTGAVTALIGNQQGTTELSFQPIGEPSAMTPGALAQRLASAPTMQLDQVGEPPESPAQAAAPLPQAAPLPPRPTQVMPGTAAVTPTQLAEPSPPQPAQAAPLAQAGGPSAPPRPAQPAPLPPRPGQGAEPPPAPAPPAQAAPPPQAAPPGPPGPPTKPTPVLVTRIGGAQRIFPVGVQVRVGRDPSLELVSLNPLVSRETHGVITSDEGGATYTDQSRRGTFLNGKPLRGPLRITESVVLRLGDPATGEELGITPPLSSTRLARNRGRRIRGSRARMAALAGAVAVVAGVVAAVVVTTTARPPAAKPTPSPTGVTLSGGLPLAVLHHAETATVRLLIGSPSNYTGWGSGTLISPTGLILTNAHVAEPQAVGAPVAMGLPATQLGPNPPYLTVELTTGQASPVVARYRARPVAADGYLDFAVVQIYATVGGQPVNPDSLHLPYLTLGNDNDVQLDQTVTVLGFPGVAESDSITVTSGVISTFVPDPLGIVDDPRFELETTARVAHGNSGGAAINDAGQLVGVPSEEVTGEGADISWRLRAVSEALPLIKAARDHTTYHSKILVQLTGQEQVGARGIGTTFQAACSGGRSIPAGPSAMFGVDYAQFPKGLDVAVLIDVPGGTTVTGDTGGLPEAIITQSSGCISYELDASQLGLAVLPSGTYQLQLLGGPELTPLDTPTNLRVGAATGASP